MNFYSLINRDIYYTHSHEWIQFVDNVAYVGVNHLRLSEAHKVKKITYTKIYGFKPKGDVLAIIQLDLRQIHVHMPVNGRIISIHNSDRMLDPNILLSDVEHKVWLAKICPDQSLQKCELLSHDPYKSNIK